MPSVHQKIVLVFHIWAVTNHKSQICNCDTQTQMRNGNAPILCGLKQIKFSLEKTIINSIKNISAEDGGNWSAAWPRATAAVTAMVMVVAAVAGVAAAAVRGRDKLIGIYCTQTPIN